MSIEIKVPALPESVSDATIASWHKKVGDHVKKDENLLDLETDKVVLEVSAPADGVLETISKETGAVVRADDVLALLQPSGATATIAPVPIPVAATPAPTAVVNMTHAAPATGANPVLTPAARRMVAEKELDPQQITGTGKGGKIVPSDVERALQHLDVVQTSPTPQVAPSDRMEQRVPMTRMRARIAERLLAVTQQTAMLTTFNEVNMKPIMDIRARYKDKFEKEQGVKLGFMSFFVKAVVAALARFPSVNASIDGDDLVYHGYFDIGIAVSTDRGLVVPIIRDADQLTLADIEKMIRDFALKARDNKLTLDDMKGGTFTITNGGVFGSLLSTPILNAPQSAILGMHTIQERAVVENGQIVVRPMMYLALSYDHRIIDGKNSVSFLVTVKEFLEDPTRLVLGV